MKLRLLAGASLGIVTGLAGLFAQSSAPVPQNPAAAYPDDRTGIIYTEVGQGSGSIVSHPRIVLSCAHVAFDDYLNSSASGWTNLNGFKLAWNGDAEPSHESFLPLRGYTRFARYAESALNPKKANQAFAEDFVAHFSYFNLTDTAPATFWRDGVAALRSSAPKRITGYPGALYREGDPLKYRLHRTPDFTNRLFVEQDRYLGATGPSTGGGNSGGPIWVFDSKDGQWKFAGVLVSGLEVSQGDPANEIGVVGVNGPAWSLVTAAIKASGGAPAPTALTFTTTTVLPAGIPDANRTGLRIPIDVVGAGKRLATLRLTLSTRHAYPNDLEITLRSPSRRNLVITKRPKLDELFLYEREIVGFAGEKPNGRWTLIVRDLAGGDVGAVTEASLQVFVQ